MSLYLDNIDFMVTSPCTWLEGGEELHVPGKRQDEILLGFVHYNFCNPFQG